MVVRAVRNRIQFGSGLFCLRATDSSFLVLRLLWLQGIAQGNGRNMVSIQFYI